QVEEMAAGAERVDVRGVVARAGAAGGDQGGAVAEACGQRRAARRERLGMGELDRHRASISAPLAGRASAPARWSRWSRRSRWRRRGAGAVLGPGVPGIAA